MKNFTCAVSNFTGKMSPFRASLEPWNVTATDCWPLIGQSREHNVPHRNWTHCFLTVLRKTTAIVSGAASAASVLFSTPPPTLRRWYEALSPNNGKWPSLSVFISLFPSNTAVLSISICITLPRRIWCQSLMLKIKFLHPVIQLLSVLVLVHMNLRKSSKCFGPLSCWLSYHLLKNWIHSQLQLVWASAVHSENRIRASFSLSLSLSLCVKCTDAVPAPFFTRPVRVASLLHFVPSLLLWGMCACFVQLRRIHARENLTPITSSGWF